MGGARPDNVALQWAARGSDVRCPPRSNQRPGQLDGAALGSSGDKARDNLQYRWGTAFWRSGPGVIVDAHSACRKSPMAFSGILPRHDGATIAYHQLAGRVPGIVFLGGFRSDMTGTKALFLEEFCGRRGHAYVRFVYFGHGASSGDVALGTIGRWVEDAVEVIDALTEGRQILIGSSMGGWIMLLAALARIERIQALVGIAAAPDFTEDLVWSRLNAAQRNELRETGAVTLPSSIRYASDAEKTNFPLVMSTWPPPKFTA